jgi:hypothetical protein
MAISDLFHNPDYDLIDPTYDYGEWYGWMILIAWTALAGLVTYEVMVLRKRGIQIWKKDS